MARCHRYPSIACGSPDAALPCCSTSRCALSRPRTSGADNDSAQRFLFEVAAKSMAEAAHNRRHRYHASAATLRAGDAHETRRGQTSRRFMTHERHSKTLPRRPDGVSRRRRAASCLLPGLPLTIAVSMVAVVLIMFQDFGGGLSERRALAGPASGARDAYGRGRGGAEGSTRRLPRRGIRR